jgi:predicted nucleic acid-binding protein
VKFLLDVNALLAWRHPNAEGHAQFHAWRQAHAADRLASCAITELGFLRVSMVAFHYDLAQATTALTVMKGEIDEFFPVLPASAMQAWATSAARTTDAYLVQLAGHHGARLATFDTHVPGATLIR